MNTLVIMGCGLEVYVTLLSYPVFSDVNGLYFSPQTNPTHYSHKYMCTSLAVNSSLRLRHIDLCLLVLHSNIM